MRSPEEPNVAPAGSTVMASPKVRAAVGDLVSANRILAALGVLDAFGHVSVRHPERADRYLLSRSCAAEQVTGADIMTFDLESNVQDGDPRVPYLERFIHGRIYAERDDVAAVVHSHAPAVIPFAASTVSLRPIYHMSSFLGSGAQVFEMREAHGQTDLLVRNDRQGASLAEALGKHAVVLMRGHGFCAVGRDLKEAVFRAHYTQLNAALQQQAIGLGGGITYLTPEECELATATNYRVVERPWGLWRDTFG